VLTINARRLILGRQAGFQPGTAALALLLWLALAGFGLSGLGGFSSPGYTALSRPLVLLRVMRVGLFVVVPTGAAEEKQDRLRVAHRLLVSDVGGRASSAVRCSSVETLRRGVPDAMQKRLKALRDWCVEFLKEYLPWTGTDQFLDSAWGKRFLAFLGGAVVTGAGWMVSFLTHLPSALTYVFLGGFLTTALIAILIFLFSPTSPKQKKSRYISGEIGFFDAMVNMESAHKAFMGVMSKISQTQVELNARIRGHTAAMGTIQQSGRNVFARMRKEAQRAARSTDAAATELEENLPELAESISFFFEGHLRLVGRANPADPGQREGLQTLKNAVASLRKSNAENRAAQTNFRKALEGPRGFSQDLNAAIDRMSEKIAKTISVLDDVETRCNAINTAIDSKLMGAVAP